jgi:hypothetical protein
LYKALGGDIELYVAWWCCSCQLGSHSRFLLKYYASHHIWHFLSIHYTIINKGQSSLFVQIYWLKVKFPIQEENISSQTLIVQNLTLNNMHNPNHMLQGWSELAATNAPVEDEPVQLVRRGFFFHLLSAPKFSTYHLPPPSYPPPTNPTPPHSMARAPKTSSGWSWSAGARAVVVERELERLEPQRDPLAHQTHAPTRR